MWFSLGEGSRPFIDRPIARFTIVLINLFLFHGHTELDFYKPVNVSVLNTIVAVCVYNAELNGWAALRPVSPMVLLLSWGLDKLWPTGRDCACVVQPGDARGR